MTDGTTLQERMRARIDHAVRTAERRGHLLGPFQWRGEEKLSATAVCRKCGAELTAQYIIGGPGSTGDIFFISGSAFNDPCVANSLKF
jgi:hypothetical protein